MMIIGPFFKAVGAHIGIEINATSALTAGFVMGIMIIPFVSSLSDDIITQVPRALRDGSLGLGATKSETIRQVVYQQHYRYYWGIFIGCITCRGETMIVVLAAGNSPLLHANPFEAVSTVTVTIVKQLTGDTDFASPQPWWHLTGFNTLCNHLGIKHCSALTLCVNTVSNTNEYIKYIVSYGSERI